MRTEQDARAALYNLAGSILLGTATQEQIESVVAEAKKFNLLPLLNQEFLDVHSALRPSPETSSKS